MSESTPPMHLSDITHPNQLHGLSIRHWQQIASEIQEKSLQTKVSAVDIWPGLGVCGGTDAGAFTRH